MKFFFSLLLIICGLVTSLWILGAQITEQNLQPRSLISSLVPTPGNSVSGVILFTKDPNGVKVKAKVSGLPPGPHGFHIHEFGNLTEPHGGKIGKHLGDTGHKSPEGSEGSSSEGSSMTRPDGRPIGDMEMLKANNKGYAEMNMVIQGMNLHDIIGRSVAIHEHEDRFENGKWDSGPKIAIGVIGIAKH